MASMIRGSRVDQGAVVLFDGTCAFCAGAVKFIATRDPQGYFRFGASQTDKATALLALYGMTRQAARSLILIEHGQIYLRSTASLRIARRLRWPWSLLGGLLIIPRPLRLRPFDARFPVLILRLAAEPARILRFTA